MKPNYNLLPFMVMCVFASACTPLRSQITSYTPPKQTELKLYERVLNKSFDETWTSIIEYSAGAFFRIKNFEKSSGLITLSFGSGEPWKYVDCGYANIDEDFEPVLYAKYLSKKYDGNLDGEMNIIAKSLDTNKTMVRVNARYIFTVKVPFINDKYVEYQKYEWVFDSGNQSIVIVSPPDETRTCMPSYLAEKSILNAVEK